MYSCRLRYNDDCTICLYITMYAEAVFEQTSPLVVSVLDGFNVCIFACGQTGTGKTSTMEGTAENRGVNYRTLEKLFSLSEERSDTMRYEMSVSMLEIYNEKIRDLLVKDAKQPAKKLKVKLSTEGTHEVSGLSEVRVHNTDEVWNLLKSGSQARSVGSTNANECSSRSLSLSLWFTGCNTFGPKRIFVTDLVHFIKKTGYHNTFRNFKSAQLSIGHFQFPPSIITATVHVSVSLAIYHIEVH
nr:kinesin-like protein KIFC3 [Tanacetum cinerariifolium]